MLYHIGNHANPKCIQPQPSPLQGKNGGKNHHTWNFGYNDFNQSVSDIYNHMSG